jgi:hypothetical protein
LSPALPVLSVLPVPAILKNLQALLRLFLLKMSTYNAYSDRVYF